MGTENIKEYVKQFFAMADEKDGVRDGKYTRDNALSIMNEYQPYAAGTKREVLQLAYNMLCDTDKQVFTRISDQKIDATRTPMELLGLFGISVGVNPNIYTASDVAMR